MRLLFVLLLAGVLFSGTGCEDDGDSSTKVRFRNDSPARVVYAVWDGVRMQTLVPGETSPYRRANPGTHTIEWWEDGSNRRLTSMAWPSLVKGQYYTFPYN